MSQNQSFEEKLSLFPFLSADLLHLLSTSIPPANLYCPRLRSSLEKEPRQVNRRIQESSQRILAKRSGQFRFLFQDRQQRSLEQIEQHVGWNQGRNCFG